MSFLNPILLAGLAGISIPILIHLLNRRRFRRLSWAAMRYLRASVERNQRRMKLQDWVLLALRCLLVALLALLLARPALRAFSGGWLEAEGATVVVLDRSGSMGTLEGNRSRFDHAREAAREAMASVPPGSTAALLPVPFSAEATPFLVPEQGGRDWNALLDGLTPTAAAANLAPAIARALEHLQQQSAARHELVVISDRQQLAWRELEAISESISKSGNELQAHVVFVGGADPPLRQLGISKAGFAQTLVTVGEPARFDITVRNHGTQPAQAVPVRVLVNGSPAGEPLNIATIPPGESVTVPSYLPLPQPGYHQVRAELPEDSVPFDDARTAIVRVFEQVRLLLVDGDSGTRRRDAETFFLEHALTAGASGNERAPITVEVVGAQELTAKALDGYAAVFLANVPNLAPDLGEALNSYLRKGGGLIIFPGDRVDRDFYNLELSERAGLLPASFGERWQSSPAKPLVGEASSHPLMEALTGFGGSSLGAQFHEAFNLKLPSPVPAEVAVVLQFEDGAPALLERRIGRGWVFLFASAADTAWNDLAVRPVFVPLLRQLTGRILTGADAALHVEAGTPFEYPLPATSGTNAVVVYPLDGAQAKGVRRRGESQANGASIRYANTLAAGAYEATIENQPLRLLFAVQPALEESNPQPLTAAQLDSLASVAHVVFWTPGTDLGAALSARRTGAELWKLLLAGAFLVGITEIFLAQRFSRSK